MKLMRIIPEQIEEVLEIYRPYIERTAITFEYTVPSIEAFAKRVEGITQVYPWLTAVENGRTVGYAYTSRFKERAAFGWAVETSIYLKEEAIGRGTGRALYEALEELSRLQGVHRMYGVITDTAWGSRRFHERMGYRELALLPGCGFKQGSWYGIVYAEKVLRQAAGEPEPLKRIDELPRQTVEDILRRHSAE